MSTSSACPAKACALRLRSADVEEVFVDASQNLRVAAAVLLAPEVTVEAAEGESSRHGRLPARTQGGELADELAPGQPGPFAQASKSQDQLDGHRRVVSFPVQPLPPNM
jgi:hypothetical protein